MAANEYLVNWEPFSPKIGGRGANPRMHPQTLLHLLQLADSSFPTGAYAFSNGIEGLHAFGLIAGADDLAAIIQAHIEETLSGIELPAVYQAHRAAANADLAALIDLDSYVSALKPVPVFAAASTRVGRRFLDAAWPLIDRPMVTAYAGAVASGEASGHHPVAFGVVMAAAGLDEKAAATVHGAGVVGGQVMAAVRLGFIGQVAAQRIIAGLRPDLLAAIDRAATLDRAEMGAYLPLADLAGLAQPALASRLFGS